jgi:hypothetical protein
MTVRISSYLSGLILYIARGLNLNTLLEVAAKLTGRRTQTGRIFPRPLNAVISCRSRSTSNAQ